MSLVMQERSPPEQWTPAGLGSIRKTAQPGCPGRSRSDHSLLVACVQRLAWVAVDIAAGAGWSSALSLLAASPAALDALSALLGHVQSRLPGRLLVRCADSAVLEFDLQSGSWSLLGAPGQPAGRRPRALLACGDRLVAVTGGGELQCFDEVRGSWQALPAEPVGQSLTCWSWGVAACKGQAYLMEACQGGTRIRRVDPGTQTSKQLLYRAAQESDYSRLLTAAMKPLVMGDVIYWFTLDDTESECMLSVIAVNVETRQFSEVEALVDIRIGRIYCDHMQAVAVAGCIYVVAHCDVPTARGCESSVLAWRLQPEAGTWRRLPPAPTPRTRFAAGALDGRLYLVGGEGTRTPGVLGTVERFDPVRWTWEAQPSMPTPRSGPAVVARHGRLYALGGAGDAYGDGGAGSWPGHAAESFDPRRGVWTRLPHIPEAAPGSEASRRQPDAGGVPPGARCRRRVTAAVDLCHLEPVALGGAPAGPLVGL